MAAGRVNQQRYSDAEPPGPAAWAGIVGCLAACLFLLICLAVGVVVVVRWLLGEVG